MGWANIKAKTKIQRHSMGLANSKTTTKKITKAKTRDMHNDYKTAKLFPLLLTITN